MNQTYTEIREAAMSNRIVLVTKRHNSFSAKCPFCDADNTIFIFGYNRVDDTPTICKHLKSRSSDESGEYKFEFTGFVFK